MTGLTQAAPNPPAEPLRDASGVVSTSWQLYFSQLSDYQGTSGTGLTQAAAQAAAAAAQAGTANTSAIAAGQAAETAQTEINALIASPPNWVIGDYRQTSLASLGPKWLVCSGGDASQATYPDLYAAIGSVTGPGTAANTFKLPSIPIVYDSSSPNVPMLQTFVKALA